MTTQYLLIFFRFYFKFFMRKYLQAVNIQIAYENTIDAKVKEITALDSTFPEATF